MKQISRLRRVIIEAQCDMRTWWATKDPYWLGRARGAQQVLFLLFGRHSKRIVCS